MHRYWRDVLISLGAVPVEKNIGLRDELIRTLRKRLGRPKGDLTFSSEAELDRLARESIRFGRMTGKSDRFVDYGTLYKRWKAVLDADLEEASTHLSEEDKAHYRNRSRLDRSIQHLCQRQILFQGREWQCPQCFNRNWATVDFCDLRQIGAGVDQVGAHDEDEVAIDAAKLRVTRVNDEHTHHAHRHLHHFVRVRVVHERAALPELELVDEGLSWLDVRL